MLYKPSFCCHCGEKIEPADWNIFSSRRFCDVCKEENKGFEILAKLAVVAAFLLPLSVAGSFLRTGDTESGQAQTVSLVQTAKKPPAPDMNRVAQSASRNPEAIDNKDITGLPSSTENPVPEIGKQPQNQKITSEGEVFYCGAITKKGTACTRKVKTKGYCWQHSARTVSISTGKPAAGN